MATHKTRIEMTEWQFEKLRKFWRKHVSLGATGHMVAVQPFVATRYHKKTFQVSIIPEELGKEIMKLARKYRRAE